MPEGVGPARTRGSGKETGKKFAKNLAVKNKGSTFVTAFRKGNGAENIEMMR